MAHSMTAFARLDHTGEWGRLTWELRSVNHRHLEVGLRLPEELRALESEVRSRIAARLARGKLDAALRFEAAAPTEHPLKVNEALARRLLEATAVVAQLMRAPAAINPLEVLRWPGVLEAREADPDLLSAAALQGLDAALAELSDTRAREGARLRGMVLQRCAAMADLTRALRVRVPEIIDALRARQRQRIEELGANLDPARLEQECALLIQRLDVAEELDRLETHLAEVARVLDQREPIGRRLDFLMQELNREANTLGSKSAHVDSTGAAVELKVLIEQMREQIQNLE